MDPSTGHYSSSLKSPTDIPADQALTAYGLEQSRQLAAQLLTLRPPVGRVYSSPYYRCLQTLGPFVEGARQQQQQQQLTQVTPGPASPSPLKVRGEAGLSEWYGSAPFDHPTSAPPEKLRALFAWLDEDYTPAIEPPRRGESIGELHGRVAAAAQAIIDQCDRDGVRAVLLCTHAAVMIALGRVLTGALPQDPAAEDFGAFTCGLSVFRRRRTAPGAQPAIRAGALTAVSAALPITPLLGNEGGDRAPSQHGEWGCGAQHQPGVPRRLGLRGKQRLQLPEQRARARLVGLPPITLPPIPSSLRRRVSVCSAFGC